jgi:hypothetical protein
LGSAGSEENDVPESDWLNQNAHRHYPLVPSADFTVDTGLFDGKIAFVDAGFTLGIASAFEHAQDHIFLERYYMTASVIRFVFRLEYAPAVPYPAMQCYEWVFEFPIDAPFGATVSAVPTRISDFHLIGEENVEMGLGFLTVGFLDIALASAVAGNVFFTQQPQVEPALLQSAVNTFVNSIKLANEARPCPPACDSSSSSSSSSSPSSSSPSSPSSSSSSSSSSPDCEDPEPPEPATLDAPTRVDLPGGVFTGQVKLKAGYNCLISIDGNRNRITIKPSLSRGEGMQAEDLRLGEDGIPFHETCLDCGGLVYAINSHGFDVEHIQFVGGQGVVVEPDAENHRVVVRFEEEGICRVDV